MHSFLQSSRLFSLNVSNCSRLLHFLICYVEWYEFAHPKPENLKPRAAAKAGQYPGHRGVGGRAGRDGKVGLGGPVGLWLVMAAH